MGERDPKGFRLTWLPHCPTGYPPMWMLGFAEGRDVRSARATEQLGKNGRLSAETQSAQRLLPLVATKQTEYGAALS